MEIMYTVNAVSGVRIPISAPKKTPRGVFLFLEMGLRSRGLRKCPCGTFLPRSVDETFPQNVNPRCEMKFFLKTRYHLCAKKDTERCLFIFGDGASKPRVKKMSLRDIFTEER